MALPFAPTRCGHVDGAMAAHGIMDMDAPESTKKIEIVACVLKKNQIFC
jgi:hypothetical protein